MNFFLFINGKIEVFLEPVNVLFGHVASHVVKNEIWGYVHMISFANGHKLLITFIYSPVNTTMKLALVCLLTWGEGPQFGEVTL